METTTTEAEPVAPRATGVLVTVRALQAGYYGNGYRKAEEWFLADEGEVSPIWMEVVPDGTPVIEGLDPPEAALGSPSFTLRVLGRGFTADSVLLWNGAPEPTHRVSDTELRTTVNMETAEVATAVAVTVQALGGLVSAPATFTLTDPTAPPEPPPEPEP